MFKYIYIQLRKELWMLNIQHLAKFPKVHVSYFCDILFHVKWKIKQLSVPWEYLVLSPKVPNKQRNPNSYFEKSTITARGLVFINILNTCILTLSTQYYPFILFYNDPSHKFNHIWQSKFFFFQKFDSFGIPYFQKSFITAYSILWNKENYKI